MTIKQKNQFGYLKTPQRSYPKSSTTQKPINLQEFYCQPTKKDAQYHSGDIFIFITFISMHVSMLRKLIVLTPSIDNNAAAKVRLYVSHRQTPAECSSKISHANSSLFLSTVSQRRMLKPSKNLSRNLAANPFMSLWHKLQMNEFHHFYFKCMVLMALLRHVM